MRFILNFIFFGVLFYAIYLIFPDAFHTMVGWANSIYEFIRDILLFLIDKVQEWRGEVVSSDHSANKEAFLIPFAILAGFKRLSR
jgi:hypothetical protein